MGIVVYDMREQDSQVLITEKNTAHQVASTLSGDLVSLLCFLIEAPEDSIKVCWDLDDAVSLLLRMMVSDDFDKLRDNHKCTIPPFNIFYIPEKLFSVTHIPSRARFNIYGLQQYYPSVEDPGNIDDILRLGENLLNELADMGLHPVKLTSPIAIYEQEIMQRLNIPSLKDMPLDAAELAYRCSGKLWIEAHRIGYWRNIYDYDMSSAFPSIAGNLKDYRYCKWVNSSDYQDKAIYGYAEAKTTIYSNVMVSPIMANTPDGLISPTGTFTSYLTKNELDLIREWGIGEFQIINAWWAIPKGRYKIPMPLHDSVKQLLGYKGQSDLKTTLAKRMSTGIYGKFGEEWQDQYGDYFNPGWFAEISAQAAVLIARFLYNHNIGAGNNRGYKTLLHIGVDGVKLTEPVNNYKSGWKENIDDEALILSSGLVYTKKTKPKSLTIEDIKGMISARPDYPYYEKPVNRRATLASAITEHNPEMIGREMDFSSSINLIHPLHDRVFKTLPATGRELLDNKYGSRPIRLDI